MADCSSGKREEAAKFRVAILGAGVIGLTAALHLVQRYQKEELDVTLIAERFSPNVLSDKSGAIFFLGPWSSSDEDQLSCYRQETEHQFKSWLCNSFEFFRSLVASPENAEVGISLVQGYALWSRTYPDPWWKNLVFGFRRVPLNSDEAKTFRVPSDCAEIWSYGTFTIETTLLLQWLLKKSQNLGCKVEKRKVNDLSELTSSYDVVINATGLSSCKELVRDSSLYPVRGQCVLAHAPWVKNWFAYYKPDDTHTAVIPRGSDIVLGGIAEKGNWEEEVDKAVTTDILKRCQEMIPSLRGAKVLKSWAGLRPGRDRIRLEACEEDNGSVVIHCYGHQGKGVMLSWGCAMNIGDLISHEITKRVVLQ